MSPKDSAQLMNKLVEHMEKHHTPMSTAYESTRVDTVIEETGWSREEIFKMTKEAVAVNLLEATIVTGQQRWAWDECIPEDLDLIGVLNPILKRSYQKIMCLE